MEILVDQKKVEFDGSQVCNLEEMLVKIMSEHIHSGNVIASVKVNGIAYSEKNPHDAANVLLKEIQSLEIDTMTLEEIAWHFLIKGGEQLNLLIEHVKRVSELFRIADENEANEQYAHLLESLRLFMKMVSEVRGILNIEFSAISYQDEPIEIRIQRLSDLLGQMIQVQEGEDWVMLADLLEYELTPLLSEWKSILILLKERKGN